MWRKDEKSPVPSPAPAPVTQTPQSSQPSSVRPQPAADTTRITPSVKIKGEITAREDLFIDGEVQGTIHLADAEVTIGTNGRVNADIDARAIHVEGKVNGALTATERIRLGRTAAVEGKLIAPRLAVEEGAVFRGHVDLTQSATAAQKPQLARAVGSAASTSASSGSPAPLLAKAGDTPS